MHELQGKSSEIFQIEKKKHKRDIMQKNNKENLLKGITAENLCNTRNDLDIQVQETHRIQIT